MLEDGFFLCPDDGKKILPISAEDTINGTVYCTHCKKYWRVVITNNEVLKCEERSVTS